MDYGAWYFRLDKGLNVLRKLFCFLFEIKSNIRGGGYRAIIKTLLTFSDVLTFPYLLTMCDIV